MQEVEEQQSAVVNIQPMIKRAKLRWLEHFRWKHPQSSRVAPIYLGKELRDPEISKLKLKCSGIIRVHFVLREGCEHITQMYVLMDIMIVVDVLNSLK